MIIPILIIIFMSIQGFKNLIKASTFLDESFQQLLKKSDESRRSSKMSLEYIQTLHKLFSTIQSVFERLLMDSSQEIQQKTARQGQQFFSVFQRIFSIHNSFSKKMSNNIKETIEMGNNLFKEYSNLILSFQSVIRTYIKNQQNLAEHSKRYFKMQRTMLQSVEMYKASFTDVKLVYNADERIKRYVACESTYKGMIEEVRNIQEKLIITNQLKKEVIENYKNIEYEFISAIKIVGNRVITLAELFAFQFNGMLNNLTTFLQERLADTIQPQQLPFFALEMPINDEYFTIPIIKQECKRYPYFIVYSTHIKPQYYPQVSKLYSNYAKQLSEKMQARKRSSKILFQFTYNYLKQFQKIFVSYVRDINANYEKNKKKISEIYGNQHLNFIRVFSVIFDKIIEKGETFSRAASMKVKFIENLIQDESKVMDAYLKQIKNLGEKISKKKDTKKAAMKNGVQNQEDSNVDELLRVEIQQKSQTTRYLIDNFFNKINQSVSQLNIHYNSIVSDFSNYARELYEFCCHLHDEQFQQSNFLKRYQAFQAEADEIMKLKIGFFNDLSFGTLLLGGGEEIIFQPELNKFEEFKKLKKPAQLQTFKAGEGLKRKETNDEKVNDAEEKCPESPKLQENQTSVSRTPQRQQKSQKFLKQLDFLTSKISFQQNERLRECYACGLSDKIILSGWLYITTHRLCFHSKFNPSNIFFGDTFIQIPKKDIIKIQKRQNGIIFNNSISVTTVNGQVFFTSFISRNEAFDTISEVFEISYNDDFMFQPNDENYNVQTLVEETQEDDDLKEDSIPKRREYIDKHLENFDYIEVYSTEFQFTGLNAYKYFKLFETSSDITYNRKTYKGFNMYMKEFLEHKEINLGEWTPDISPYLNPKNIKDNCPLQFKKISTSIIPVANSGIPLMPKQAHLQENIKLFFESKDKYTVQMKIQNGGIPYCQYFNIRYKRVVQTCSQNKCKLTLYYFIQFVQKTMMKSVIQSKSIEQSKTAMNRQQIQMKKYLKYLEKQQSRPKKEEESKQNWAQKVGELEKQLEQSKEHQQQLSKTVEDYKGQSQKQRKKFLVSLAVNVILILLLISIY